MIIKKYKSRLTMLLVFILSFTLCIPSPHAATQFTSTNLESSNSLESSIGSSTSKVIGIGQEVSLYADDLGYQGCPVIFFDSVPTSGSYLGIGSATNSIQPGYVYQKSMVDSGQIKFRGDREGTYTFEVSWQSGNGLQGQKISPCTDPITITITVVNPAPTNIQLTNINAPAGYSGVRVGKLISTDNYGDTSEYSIVSDSKDMFEINNGLLRIKEGKTLEEGETTTVRIRVTDSANNTFEKDLTVTGVIPEIIRIAPNQVYTWTYLGPEFYDDVNILSPEKGIGVSIFEGDEYTWDMGVYTNETLKYTAPNELGIDSFVLGDQYYIVEIGNDSDNTPPNVGNNGEITNSDITPFGVKLIWTKATDDTTIQENLEYQVYQSTSNNIDSVTNIELNGTSLGNFTKDIDTFEVTDLSPNTPYYFNVIVKDATGNKSAYTMQQVTTLSDASAPIVTTNTTISQLSSTFANVGGDVTSDGNSGITERGIVYSKVPNPTTSDNKITTSGTTGSFNIQLNGLDPKTTYHYRAYATNAKGTSYGANQTFTTLSNNAKLSNLTLSNGSLNVEFSPNTLNYTVNVPYSVESVNVSPFVQESTASVKVNNVSIPSGQASSDISLAAGQSTSITIDVTAQDGTIETYTITVTRNNLTQLNKVTNVQLNEFGMLEWDAVANASSYDVNMYKDSLTLVSSNNTVETMYNLLIPMRNNGPGNYTVKVTAKGDGVVYADGETSDVSNHQTIVKLDTVTGLTWNNNVAKWNGVFNAKGYDVQLFNNGNLIANVSNTTTDINFGSVINTNDIGMYKFKVRALGNHYLILDGEQSDFSYGLAASRVTYDGNGNDGGSVPTDNNIHVQGTAVIATQNTGNLVKNGYTFAGWNTQANGEGVDIAEGSTFTMGIENMTLYAKWKVAKKPAITLYEGNEVFVELGSQYQEPGYSASDEIDGDLTGETNVTGVVNPNQLGTYEVKYNVTNSRGIAAEEVTRTVHVVSSDLQSLSVSSGTLTPSFNPNTLYYSFSVPSNTTSIDVSMDILDATASANINGSSISPSGTQTIPLQDGLNTVTIVVTSRGGKTSTYTLEITRKLSNAETPNITTQPTDQTIIVGDTTSLIVSATVDQGDLSYQWYSNTTNSSTGGTLIDGATNTTYEVPSSTAGTIYYYVVVTNTDPSATGNQTAKATSQVANVTVNAKNTNANLSNLILSTGTLSPFFDKAVHTYTVEVPNSVNSMTITPTVEDVGKAKVGIVNQDDILAAISLNVGDNIIQVVVTAEDGITKKTYTINVKRGQAPSSGGGGSTPTPAPNPEPEPSPTPQPGTEIITVPVETGDLQQGSNVSTATIKRTTDSNGKKKDEVELTPEKATETVQKLKETGSDTARIVIPDSKDEVSEVNVSMNKTTIDALKQGNINLEIYTDNARIVISKESLSNINGDLYFNVVPIKEEQQKNEVKERATQEEVVRQVAGNRNIQVVGRPMTIETNMPSQPVDIVLPIKEITIPENQAERNEFFNKLGVFIEHSDGEKVFVKGEVVPYKNGELGLKFTISKFSTFTIINMENGWESNDGQGEHQAYIKGFSGKEFRPNIAVTREQMATMISRVLNVESSKKPFEDLSKNHWAYEAIMEVKSAGIMTGTTSTTFEPTGNVTRAQMASIAYRWVQNECKQDMNTYDSCSKITKSPSASFNDVAPNHWATDAINFMKASKIMVGYENSFRPDDKLTRAEAVVVLNELFKRGPLKGISTPTFLDVKPTHWAYEEIEEAVRTHHVKYDESGSEILN